MKINDKEGREMICMKKKSLKYLFLIFAGMILLSNIALAEEEYMTDSGEIRDVSDGDYMTDSGEIRSVSGGEYMTDSGEMGQVTNDDSGTSGMGTTGPGVEGDDTL